MSVETIVIAGAGQGGGELAMQLRQHQFAGRVILFGEETHLPYQRPPLSKAYLAGDLSEEELYLKPLATYEKAGVEFIGGVRLESIDRAGKSVALSDGRTLKYDKLALALGGRARPLSTPDAAKAAALPNHHYIRTIDDVTALRPQFDRGLRMVIVGGGYIGLEVAAVARKHGLHVTVLEAMDRVLARVTAPQVSAFYQDVHRAAGVDLRTGVSVTGFTFDKSGDAVSGVNCKDATGESVVPADVVIVGVGLLPNVEVAQAAGLVVENGIVVDEFAVTSDPDILAVGDCANFPSATLGRRIRLESVPNAMEQARAAASALTGQPKPYDPTPWFWSDQYDLKLQMVGLSFGYDDVVLRGDPATKSFAAFYLAKGKVIAVDAINRPAEFMAGKRLVAQQASLSPERLRDESVAPREWFAR